MVKNIEQTIKWRNSTNQGEFEELKKRKQQQRRSSTIAKTTTTAIPTIPFTFEEVSLLQAGKGAPKELQKQFIEWQKGQHVQITDTLKTLQSLRAIKKRTKQQEKQYNQYIDFPVSMEHVKLNT